MNDGQKPFACTIAGCEMTFANEDHLNWHHKKHDMVLNLGLANKNAEADQTPTPTRFIRNCEESPQKRGTLHIPEAASNDDTLHTPHILLNVESSSVKYSDNQSIQFNDICISRVESVPESPSSSENDLTITIEKLSPKKEQDKQINLKDKLKETIKNKGKSSLIITPVPLEKLQVTKESEKRPPTPEKTTSVKRRRRKTSSKDTDDEREKVREMNRAAQIRCRKRKQIQRKKMEEEMKTLKSDNAKLYGENQDYKHKIYALKELLVKHKKENASEDTAFVKKIEEILNSKPPPRKEKPPEDAQKTPKKIPIKPVPLAQDTALIVQKPVYLQLVGPLAPLALSLMPDK
nr:PREDICTED: cyclic AMP-dependent transcription factor ATF-7 [Tribolium castaneum]|eukprot:XP_974257.1 PREDICTED: cyclic AMP-dependent transcription factor ATF-7 [Tribolium castaneum]